MILPFVDLKRFEPNFLENWADKVAVLSKDATFIGGEEVEQLEQNLTGWTKTRYSISCANGTDAMQLALRALGIGENDKVLLPNFTFWASFEAIVNVGAIPITVDCEILDGGMSLNYFIEAVETYNPKAAILAHLFGWSTRNIKQIRDYASQNGILLLEDGAQCFGTRFEDRPIFKEALISTTSFYPSKVLGTAGNGGAVFTNDKDLALKVRQLANHGRNERYFHDNAGWNSRLGSLQAAYLNISLDFLSKRIRSRIKTLNIYRHNINHQLIREMTPPPQFITNGYCNVSIIEKVNFKGYLEKQFFQNKIGFGNIYPATISSQKGAGRYLLASVGRNEAHEICRGVLNLPLFPYMTEEEVSLVIDIVNKAVQTYPDFNQL